MNNNNKLQNKSHKNLKLVKYSFILIAIAGITVGILFGTGVIKTSSSKSKAPTSPPTSVPTSPPQPTPTSPPQPTPTSPPQPAPTSPPQPPTSLCDPCKIQTGYFDTVGNSYTFYPTEAACIKSGRNTCQKITVTTDDKHSCCKGDTAYRYGLWWNNKWGNNAFVNQDDCKKAQKNETQQTAPDLNCLGQKDTRHPWHF